MHKEKDPEVPGEPTEYEEHNQIPGETDKPWKEPRIDPEGPEPGGPPEKEWPEGKYDPDDPDWPKKHDPEPYEGDPKEWLEEQKHQKPDF